MSNFQYTRPNRFPPIIKNLVIINVIVYIGQLILDKSYHISDKLELWPILPEKLQNTFLNIGALESNQLFQPYQVATHFFLHDPHTIFHIVFNMFVLWMFGSILENVWGGKRFLLFYLACGVGAALFHLGIQYFRLEQISQHYSPDQLVDILQNPNNPEFLKILRPMSPALGASGAIMGVMAAFAYLFPNTELYIMFIPIPIKAKWAVLGYVAIDLFAGVADLSSDPIAHFAHLGGALTGIIIVLIWNKTNRKTLY